MTEVEYQAPRSVGEAVRLLNTSAVDAAVLAGGTDLLVQAQFGRRRPGLFVDVKRIPELMAIEFDESGLRLGAAVPAVEIGECDELRAAYPGLAEAVELIGSTQIQGRASVGGNLCNASPAADTTPSLIALGTVCVVVGPDGERRLPVESFVTAPGTTALERGELLAGLEIPRPPPRSADAYLRFIPRTEMDIAVVGAAVRLELDGAGVCTAARVVLGAVAPTAISVPEAAEALVGSAVGADALAAAGAAARAAARPIDDLRGTAEYRSKLAAVLTRRAAAIAAGRARERN